MRLAISIFILLVLSNVSPLRANYAGDVKICFLPKENPDAAIAACTRLLSQPARKSLSVQNTYGLRATAYNEKKEWDNAISDWTSGIASAPEGEFANTMLTERGVSKLNKGDTDAALADLNEVVRKLPNRVDSYNLRAFVWTLKGDYQSALKDYTRAVELDAKNYRPRVNRGETYNQLGDYENAMRDFNEALRLRPPPSDTALTTANRGSVWLLRGELDKALADFETAIKISPKASGTYSSRGDLFRYRGEYTKALADFDLASKLDNTRIGPIVGRGLVFEKQGNLAAAKAEFEKAIAAPIATFGTEASNIPYRKTAEARLSAYASGVVQPTILPASASPKNSGSIPTPNVTIPAATDLAGKIDAIKYGRRIALVIGNAAYTNATPLKNPRKDSESIAASLRNIGFDKVTLTNDATREKLIESLRAFANESENADWAMVYYAGHGIEVGGVNYLVPVDAKLAVDRDIEYEAVSLSQILRATDSAKKIKLIMLDACRDNPFTPRKTVAAEQVASASTAGGTIGTRSTNGRGLAEVKVQGATLVVYAAKDGQVALDGEGGNSPFAVAVVQRLATPGVEINKLFRLVRDDVMEATAGRQEPYTYGSLPGKEDFFFVVK